MILRTDLTSDDIIQRIWTSTPQEERVTFSNTYCTKAPKVFAEMFKSVIGQLDESNSILRIPADEQETSEESGNPKLMRQVESFSLLTDIPDDEEYIEFAVNRYDKTNLPQARYQQQLSDRAERKQIIATLHKFGVETSSKTKPIEKKAKLQYNPESQLDLKPETAHLIKTVLAGKIESLTQPEAVELIYATLNKRFYRAIEDLSAHLAQPLGLEEAVEKLESVARIGLNGTYYGNAIGRNPIGYAIVKRLHRR